MESPARVGGCSSPVGRRGRLDRVQRPQLGPAHAGDLRPCHPAVVASRGVGEMDVVAGWPRLRVHFHHRGVHGVVVLLAIVVVVVGKQHFHHVARVDLAIARGLWLAVERLFSLLLVPQNGRFALAVCRGRPRLAVAGPRCDPRGTAGRGSPTRSGPRWRTVTAPRYGSTDSHSYSN